MFEYRKINMEGIDQLKWVASDKDAYISIMSDWRNNKASFFKHMTKFGTIVQAGGHCGLYPRFYGNYFENIYTFEPAPDNFEALRENCEGVTNANYHIFNLALGDTEKNIFLDMRYKNNTGQYRVIPDKDGNIPQITIDSLELVECDVIHLDIEGYEIPALKGAAKTIEKFEPVIILEAWFPKEKVYTIEYMESIGYEAVITLAHDIVFIKK
jgi:FkbM family methyltransferase